MKDYYTMDLAGAQTAKEDKMKSFGEIRLVTYFRATNFMGVLVSRSKMASARLLKLKTDAVTSCVAHCRVSEVIVLINQVGSIRTKIEGKGMAPKGLYILKSSYWPNESFRAGCRFPSSRDACIF